MAISEGHKDNFETLKRAFANGDTALMECFDTKTNQSSFSVPYSAMVTTRCSSRSHCSWTRTRSSACSRRTRQHRASTSHRSTDMLTFNERQVELLEERQRLRQRIVEINAEIQREREHQWVLSQVVGDGYTCAKCSAWTPED